MLGYSKVQYRYDRAQLQNIRILASMMPCCTMQYSLLPKCAVTTSVGKKNAGRCRDIITSEPSVICSLVHCSAWHYSALHCRVLHFSALLCIALQCILVHCIKVHCNPLQCSAVLLALCSAVKFCTLSVLYLTVSRDAVRADSAPRVT